MNNIVYTATSNGDTGVNKSYLMMKNMAYETIGFSSSVCDDYANLTGKVMSRETYGQLYREISSLENPNLIHSNSVVQ